MSGQLIVSVSGLRPAAREHAASFAEELDRRGVPVSWLVAPRLKDGYRLDLDQAGQEWLRQRRDRGDAIVLHGYDQAPTRRRRAEFARLPEHEARLRLIAADRVLEQAGLRTRVFAAPRWTTSTGALAALPHNGFRIVAGLTGIHDLERGEVRRARVLGVGDGSPTEPWWCHALVLIAGRTVRRGGLVRLAVSAKQLGRPVARQAMLDAVDLALELGATGEVYRWAPPERARVA